MSRRNRAKRKRQPITAEEVDENYESITTYSCPECEKKGILCKIYIGKENVIAWTRNLLYLICPICLRQERQVDAYKKPLWVNFYLESQQNRINEKIKLGLFHMVRNEDQEMDPISYVHPIPGRKEEVKALKEMRKKAKKARKNYVSGKTQTKHRY